MLKVRPVLKWAGGKTALLPTILKAFACARTLSHSTDQVYYEPFIGGSSVFLGIYESSLITKKSVISDINQELISTYTAIKDNPSEIIKTLNEFKLQHCKDFYMKIRSLNTNNKTLLAARMIYLNRTCFNGLYRVNKKGQFNVPIGNYKNPDIVREKEILAMSDKLQAAELIAASYENTLNKAKKNDIIYLDPPYDALTETSKFVSYTKEGFSKEDQKRLKREVDRLNNLGCFIIASNADTKFIRDLYENMELQTVQMKRKINSNAKKRGDVNELLITNFKIPND